MADPAKSGAERSAKFAVYRGSAAPPLRDGIALLGDDTPSAILKGLATIVAAGARDGYSSKALFAMPGFNLGFVEFASGYPVPLHSHDADCLYHIVAGSIRLGSAELGAGDGFFVPCDVPYTYTAGTLGVQLLEFRTSNVFHTRFTSQNPNYWKRMAGIVTANRPRWLKKNNALDEAIGMPSTSSVQARAE